MFWKGIVDGGLLLVLILKKKTIESKNYDVFPVKQSVLV
jgi:hypothetical protein